MIFYALMRQECEAASIHMVYVSGKPPPSHDKCIWYGLSDMVHIATALNTNYLLTFHPVFDLLSFGDVEAIYVRHTLIS